ncbi:hypothetical protein BKA56DRAFT_159439 [Ilyonectria sp. MPI-CAGE-AT-0026]|nr:hypothetical protein BKA56DRAFT_159439 [Ilyonectria sp. MPI-CAGE-AT-0026]
MATRTHGGLTGTHFHLQEVCIRARSFEDGLDGVGPLTNTRDPCHGAYLRRFIRPGPTSTSNSEHPPMPNSSPQPHPLFALFAPSPPVQGPGSFAHTSTEHIFAYLVINDIRRGSSSYWCIFAAPSPTCLALAGDYLLTAALSGDSSPPTLGDLVAGSGNCLAGSGTTLRRLIGPAGSGRTWQKMENSTTPAEVPVLKRPVAAGGRKATGARVLARVCLWVEAGRVLGGDRVRGC